MLVKCGNHELFRIGEKFVGKNNENYARNKFKEVIGKGLLNLEMTTEDAVGILGARSTMMVLLDS